MTNQFTLTKFSYLALDMLPINLIRKLFRNTNLALVGFCLLTACAVVAQPVRQASVIELAPKTENVQRTKVALVIGNALYTETNKLNNPVNDATDLAAKLEAVGFKDPILAINQTSAQFKQTLKTFRSRLRPNAEVVVYYAGHGMSVDGTNYLLPVDVKLESKADLEDEAISLKRIIRELNDAQVKTSVLILDSCRNNPFSRGWKGSGRDVAARGWSSEAVASAVAGIKIFYATKDGEVANDGAGRNGHFTSSLLRHIETTGMSLNDMIDQVTADLHNDPKIKQTPWSEGSMIGTYYFKPPAFSAKNASLREKGLAGDQKAFDEWLKNDPEASKNIEKFLLSKQINMVSTGQELPTGARTDKKTAALVIAQQQSEDIGQRQLGAAMAVYLKDTGLTSVRVKALADMMLQGNPFAALMVQSLEKKVKPPFPIPKKLLEDAFVEIERLSQLGDVVAISWQANIYAVGLIGKSTNQNKAFELMKQAADKNYTYAQFKVGKFYEAGNGVAKDAIKAADWYNKAADAGDSFGMVELANLYREGKSVAKDETKAYELAKKAIELGDSFGLLELGNIYLSEKSTLHSDSKAFELFKSAADSGNSRGMNHLAYMYLMGKSVSKDEVKAIEWYSKAVSEGDEYAMVKLGEMYLNGNGFAKDEIKALELFKKSAEQEFSSGMSYLGYLYYTGKGVTKDEAKAVYWYTKAAEAKDADAMKTLGGIYFNGKGALKDESKALDWFKKAAEAGSFDAQNQLGTAYRDGTLGLKPDGEQAKNWYLKAIENGSTDAMVNLGWMYEQGKIVAKNESEALKLYKKAAVANNQHGQKLLGDAYREGTLGLSQDSEQAKNWYGKAIENGNIPALNALGWMHEHGKGTPKDEVKAVALFKKAADAQNADGLYNLGVQYWNGKGGLPADKAEANRLFEKAAALGQQDALKFLAK